MRMQVVAFRTRLMDVSSIGSQLAVPERTKVEISDGFTDVTINDWRGGPVAMGDEYDVTIKKVEK